MVAICVIPPLVRMSGPPPLGPALPTTQPVVAPVLLLNRMPPMLRLASSVTVKLSTGGEPLNVATSVLVVPLVEPGTPLSQLPGVCHKPSPAVPVQVALAA